MGDPPLHFTVLGSVDLLRADGSRLLSFLAQPKRVALLAYVAIEAPGGFVQRERIMSVLWPDSDNTRARQSLRNSLYQIRQSAGAEILVNRGSADVGVDPAILFVDAVALRAAVAEGRFQDAVDLYGGPLLPGFHLDDAPDFEEWTARARAAIQADALRAFREAARAREGSGDLEAARSLLRRAQEIAPADEEILRQRLFLLARQGNRAAAVAEGEEWIEMLRSTLEIEPSEPTLRLMRDLRSGGPVDAGLPVTAPSPPSARSSPVNPSAPPTAREADPGTRAPVRGVRLPWLLATAMLALAAWLAIRKPPPAPRIAGGVIVEQFEADRAAGGRAVGVALGSLTARYLDPGAGGLLLPPEGVSAASLDGLERRLISGRVRARGDRLVADVTLATTARPGRILARATADIRGQDLEALAIGLVDELARRGDLDLPERGPVPRFSRAPGAVVSFFEGEILARAGRTQEAGDAYRRALSLDSTLAMAHYRLSVSEALLGRQEEAALASDRAVNLTDHLTEGERKLVDAWRVYQGGRVEQALPLYDALAASRGPDAEVWLRLAEIRFHWGPQLGIPRDSAANAFRVLHRLAPDDASALQHLIRLVGPSASPEELDGLMRQLASLEVSDEVWIEAAAVLALNRRGPLDPSVQRWLTGISFSLESRRLSQLAASARVPYDVVPLVRALPPTDDPFRLIARRLLLAQLAAAAGRMREAHEELAALSASFPGRALEYRCLLTLSSPLAPPPDSLRALRQRLRSADLRSGQASHLWTLTNPGIDVSRALVLDAMLTRRLGEPIDLTGLTERGRAESYDFEPDYVGYLRAESWAAEDNHGRVLAVLGPGRPESHRTYPDPLSYLAGTSKWVRIQSLVVLGRDEEALRWLETIPDVGGYDLVYVAQASLLRARILERLGRSAEAAAAYRRAAEIWEHADPEFAGLLDSARQGAERTGGVPAT